MFKNKNSAFKTFDLPLSLHLMKVLINLVFNDIKGIYKPLINLPWKCKF